MNFRKVFAFLMLATMAWVGQSVAQNTPQLNRENVKPGVDAGSGSAMFAAYCASCHGKSGKGDGPAAAALKKAPADLTQLSRRNGGQFPSAKVSFTIEGREIMASHGSRDMPVWGNIFAQMDGDKIAKLRIHNLTEHVKSIQQ